MSELFVGIDIHKESHRVAVISRDKMVNGGWDKAKPFSIKNKKADYEKVIAKITAENVDIGNVAIAIDHTGGYYSAPLVLFLSGLNYPIYFIEGKALRDFKNRFLDIEDKTDSLDCLAMARALYAREVLGQDMRISIVKPDLESKQAAVRVLLNIRWQMQKTITQLTNRLHQVMIATFPEGESKYFKQLCEVVTKYPMPDDIISQSDGLKEFRFRSKTREGILTLAKETCGVKVGHFGIITQALATQRLDMIAKMEELTANLILIASEEPMFTLLKSFPYIGDIAAVTLFSVIGDIDKWQTIAKFKKALGVYPRTSQSGNGSGSHYMGREGSKNSRRVLWQIAFGSVSPLAPDNYLRDYYRVKVAKGMPKKKALVATMGKLTRLIYFCLKTGCLYEYKKAGE